MTYGVETGKRVATTQRRSRTLLTEERQRGRCRDGAEELRLAILDKNAVDRAELILDSFATLPHTDRGTPRHIPFLRLCPSERQAARAKPDRNQFPTQGDNVRKLGIPAAAMMACAAFAPARTANAQVATILKPIQVGVAVGAAVPVSDLGNSFSTGFNVTGTIGINVPLLPIGFRIDAAYNQFSAKGTSNVSAKIAGVSGNVVFSIPGGVIISPYLIGGVGYYRVSSSATGSVASNNFGFNAGAGVKIPLLVFSTFAEARYNRVSENGGSTSFIPVTVGVMF